MDESVSNEACCSTCMDSKGLNEEVEVWGSRHAVSHNNLCDARTHTVPQISRESKPEVQKEETETVSGRGPTVSHGPRLRRQQAQSAQFDAKTADVKTFSYSGHLQAQAPLSCQEYTFNLHLFFLSQKNIRQNNGKFKHLQN